jgi:2-dehydropantoate 2-reductase
MAKILIFGAGAVGCVSGWFLHNGGSSITVVCRSNYDVVKEQGLTIRSSTLGHVLYIPTAVKSLSEAHGPFDFIVVSCKAFPGNSSLIKCAVSPETTIVLVQNGIDIEEEYARAFPSNSILSAVVYIPATQTAPGVIELGPEGRIEIGTYPANAPHSARLQVKHFSNVWTAGGGLCSTFENIQPRRWVKIAVNASWNPICALTRCDDANFLRSSDEAEVAVVRVMREIANVASAVGCDVVSDEEIDRQLGRQRSRLLTGGREPSMLTDIRHGRPIEIEAIVGNTIRIARSHSVDVPYLELLYVMAKALAFANGPDDRWKPLMKIA